jgi:hypothetical protein
MKACVFSHQACIAHGLIRSMQSIAGSDAAALVHAVPHMSRRVALDIITAARWRLQEQARELLDEAHGLLLRTHRVESKPDKTLSGAL